jgi:hypothetical protein
MVQTRSQAKKEHDKDLATHCKTSPALPTRDDDPMNQTDLWDVPGLDDDWDDDSSVDTLEDDNDIDESRLPGNESGTPNHGMADTQPVPRRTTDWTNDKLAKDSSQINEADNDDDILPTPRLNAILPNYYVPESHVPKDRVRITDHRLHLLLGNRKLKDYSVLQETFANCTVSQHGEKPLSISDFVNKKQGRKGKKSRRPKQAGHTICADIGYGDGTSPGGYRYCLVLVDNVRLQI